MRPRTLCTIRLASGTVTPCLPHSILDLWYRYQYGYRRYRIVIFVHDSIRYENLGLMIAVAYTGTYTKILWYTEQDPVWKNTGYSSGIFTLAGMWVNYVPNYACLSIQEMICPWQCIHWGAGRHTTYSRFFVRHFIIWRLTFLNKKILNFLPWKICSSHLSTDTREITKEISKLSDNLGRKIEFE